MLSAVSQDNLVAGGNAKPPIACRLSANVRDRIRNGNQTLVVLGPTGWMGSATLSMLDAALEPRLLTTRLRVFGSTARELTLPSGTVVRCEQLSAMQSANIPHAIVMHYAYATMDKLNSLSEASFTDVNTKIQMVIANAIEAWRPDAVFFPSSGAVYGRGSEFKARTIYGQMKFNDEKRLAELSAKTGTRLRIGRLFSLSGEFINKTSIYALACFLNDVNCDRPIQINAPHRVLRSYVYVGDVVNLALALTLNGGNDDFPAAMTFDMAGPQVVEMGELAQLCCMACDRPDIGIVRPPMDPAKEDRMLGDPTHYLGLLAASGLTDLPLLDQVRVTGQWLRAC